MVGYEAAVDSYIAVGLDDMVGRFVVTGSDISVGCHTGVDYGYEEVGCGSGCVWNLNEISSLDRLHSKICFFGPMMPLFPLFLL